MDFVTLERSNLTNVRHRVTQAAEAHGLTNAFNPSGADGNFTHIAFRAEGHPGERPFRAYLLTTTAHGEDTLIDLSAASAAEGVPKTADPKLVQLGGELYVTFNTGNVHHGQNEIYLRRVHPTLGPLQRCVLSSRRMVEKNWGFYSTPGVLLGAVYSLAPLVLLKLIAGELGVTAELVFDFDRVPDMSGRFPRLHLGSQPMMLTDQRAIVAANQQRPIPGLPRKIYFGRLAEIDFSTGHTALSRRGIIHAWRSMLPPRKRHNPGLFSATYFSGLALQGENLILSYGINDTDFGIASVPRERVWR